MDAPRQRSPSDKPFSFQLAEAEGFVTICVTIQTHSHGKPHKQYKRKDTKDCQSNEPSPSAVKEGNRDKNLLWAESMERKVLRLEERRGRILTKNL